MAARFACRPRVVMAGQAGARHHSNMAEYRRSPYRSAMTTVARRNGGNVSSRFCHCPKTVTRYVTTCAIPRSSLEYTLDMAGPAGNLSVGASKVKTRFDMVKFGSARVGWLGPCKMSHGQ